MKTKYFIFAASVLVALASCSSDEYVGDNSPTSAQSDGSIQFGFEMPNATRADIVGSAAADLLGNAFYVTGTKADMNLGTPIPTNSPTTSLVFDNYLVHYGVNTAGTTESNTANWEYVGVTPGDGDYTNWDRLSSLTTQTIKYWDYSSTQYDFMAFSVGKGFKAKKDKSTPADDEIGVTAMKYGSGLVSQTAYTFYIPKAEALKGAYITDIVKAQKENNDYGKEVKLQFKSLGSKIRLALYETVPGYSVKDVKFYTVDGTNTGLGSGSTTTAALISADETYGFATKGRIDVSFPNIGTDAISNNNYNKASVTVTPTAPVSPAVPTLYQEFGTLSNFQGEQLNEENANYIGRDINHATFAGTEALGYYQVVFPVTNSKPLTLRVDYTLVSIDGSGEEINVYGAKAVVPSTYTVWQPNYAYTYIFKISDNTNGWTSTDAAKDGLFPITFDAVVAEVKDKSGEQTTVTTVATPSITTYQQGHVYSANNEYSIATGKNIYVQVMDNENTTSPKPVGVSPSTKPLLNDDDPYIASKLYKITAPSGVTISEATVMDALQNRTTSIIGSDNADITGRNGITLTKDENIDNTVETIVNGADDQPIDLRDDDPEHPGSKLANSGKGKAAEINISALSAGTYAYVYDYGNATKTTKTFYQPTTQKSGAIADGTKYITLTELAAIDEKTSGSEPANDAYIYFSKTTDGVNITYSYYSVDGKEGNLPAGLLKVAKASDLLTGDGTTVATANTFVFDSYIRNNGDYAVKVIKIVD